MRILVPTGNYFFNFQFFLSFFSFKIVGTLLTKKKREKDKKKKKVFCLRPSGHNFGHPLDRKQTSFKGGPKICHFSKYVFL